MRQSGRLKRSVYYANYVGDTPVLDSNGDLTSDVVSEYTIPVKINENISASTSSSSGVLGAGYAAEEPFGQDIDYKRIMYTTKKYPIKEGTLVWIETSPPTDNSGSDADYVVVAVADSINNTRYALRSLKKSGD